MSKEVMVQCVCVCVCERERETESAKMITVCKTCLNL